MKRKFISHKDKKIVLSNFFSLTGLQGLNYLLPVIILPYLIRVIGPEKFGLIAFAQALIQYFMIFTDYGFSLSATKEIALWREHKENVSAIFSAVMTVKLILTLISFIILMLIISFIPRFKNDWLVYIFSFGAVVGNTLFPVWFFQGTEKMKYIAIINVIGGIIATVSIFVFVKAPSDYLLVPLIYSVFFLITGLYALYIAFRRFELNFVFQNYADIKKKLITGRDIFLSVVAINAYTTTRVFAVGLLTNNILTGYYSIAERIANLIQAFPLDSLTQSIYPRMSKIFARNKKKALNLMNKIQDSTTIIYAVTLPVASFIAPWVVKIICGSAYTEVILTLRVLLVSIFFIVANAFRVQFLIVCGKPDAYSRLHVAAALVGFPLIFLLITSFSFIGAAISTIILEVGIFIITFEMLKNLAKTNFQHQKVI